MEKKERRKTEKLDSDVGFFKTFKGASSWLAYIPDFLTPDEAKPYFDSMNTVEFQPEKRFYGNPPAREVKWFGDFDYTYSGTKKPAYPAPDFVTDMAKKVELVANKYQIMAHEKRLAKQAAKEQKILDDRSKRRKISLDSGKEEPITTDAETKVTTADAPETKSNTADAVTVIKYTGSLHNKYTTGKNSVSWHADDEKDLQPGAPISSLSVGAVRTFKLRFPKLIYHLPLLNGSLLIMGGKLQKHSEHAVEKEPGVEGIRFNSTYRVYKQGGLAPL
jgi:alkylated DNA repair dioxygenase AlkB